MRERSFIVLAWVLVGYLLIEADPTYRWVRGFVAERLRARFDRTAREAAEAARGYVVGNVTTSVCAAIYFYIWLLVLHVPAALLLALLMNLLASLGAITLLAFLLPSAVILGQRGRSRCRRQENRKDEFTHDADFLLFPATGSAPRQMSGG